MGAHPGRRQVPADPPQHPGKLSSRAWGPKVFLLSNGGIFVPAGTVTCARASSEPSGFWFGFFKLTKYLQNIPSLNPAGQVLGKDVRTLQKQAKFYVFVLPKTYTTAN